ncbi:MAG TPA: dihydrodipicolinate reductase C-terminal domain-containing protein [Ignavibacteriaceae bacterium]|nr:dihydrodipicolinate reductase C-terminal domain-containing protein [Ignavibacteriaceae bacterium]
MRKIKYGLIGSSGKMGREIENVFSEAGNECVFKFDIDGEQKFATPELLIDFSLPEVLEETIDYIKTYNVPLIIGTTGLSNDQLEILKLLSQKIPVVQSYNFSIGIQLLLRMIESIKNDVKDWDIEIEETHHRFKKDKPSGTAIMIKNLIGKEVSISSLRLGNVPGVHTIQFGSLGEILKIEHQALSRRTFADGVLMSANFILKKQNGFYSFKDVINNK